MELSELSSQAYVLFSTQVSTTVASLPELGLWLLLVPSTEGVRKAKNLGQVKDNHSSTALKELHRFNTAKRLKKPLVISACFLRELRVLFVITQHSLFKGWSRNRKDKMMDEILKVWKAFRNSDFHGDSILPLIC